MRPLKKLLIAAERVWLPIERTRLRLSGEPRLARALSGHPSTVFGLIEQGRQEMLEDESPLVDGSLGPSGPFDEGQTVSSACGVSKPPNSAKLLYSIAREYRPATIIELGTNVGISSAYLAASGANVTTFEVSPYRLRLARRLHKSLNLSLDYVQGLFNRTLENTLERMALVEMAFVDGHHQYRPTLAYFESILAKSAPGCVFVFDDIRWSSGMKKAWAELRRDHRFETVADLGGMGVGILSR